MSALKVAEFRKGEGSTAGRRIHRGAPAGAVLHLFEDIFDVPEDGAATEILVPAAVGDVFGRIMALVAVGNFEEFVGGSL